MNPEESPSTISELLDYYDRLEGEQRRLDSLGAPQIGIFYVIKHKIYADREFKDLVKPSLDGIRRYGMFESLWRSLCQFRILEEGLYHYPRGRIVFNESLSKFFIYVDICLLEPENRSMLNQIFIEFNLDHSQVSVMPSFDYKCARCHDDWGFSEDEVVRGERRGK